MSLAHEIHFLEAILDSLSWKQQFKERKNA